MGDKRIRLRPLKEEDAPRMLEWMQNDDVTKYLNIGGKDTKIETVLDFIKSTVDESENIHRAVVDETDQYLGTISLKHVDIDKKEAEYAISMHMDAIGTGASRKATEKIIDFAFKDMDLDRVVLCVRRDNCRALKFYNKCGFAIIPCPGYGLFLDKELMWFEQSAVDSR